MPRENYYLPSRKLVNQSDASLVASSRVPRSKFIGSWTRKTALDAGILYPIMIDEVLPGDHLTYDVTAYVRMATPVFPLFDNQRIDTHFFFVPARILWQNWTAFMGEKDPGDDTEYSIPVVELSDEADGAVIGSIYDHFGLPCEGQLNTAPSYICINALPFRAYNRIYNDWFRDQNLIDALETNYGSDGPDDQGDYTLQRRAKFHDYFTSALPQPQKGTAQTVFASGLAPVRGIGFGGTGTGLSPTAVRETPNQRTDAGGVYTYPNPQYFDTENQNTTPDGLLWYMDGAPTTGYPQIFADLGASTGMTIADFRLAMLIQELLERDNRGGTRYTETIRSHFDVNSPDGRLQRPEYIGGGQTPLQITPIAQTAPSASEPLGTLGGAGTAAGQHHASYAATEHGYIIGLMSIRSEISYQQGIHKMWTRTDKHAFYWPTLAGLSEQAIETREIYARGDYALDTAVWGYQERYQEYRTRQSEVTGIMRSLPTSGSLDAWHLAQVFTPYTSPPALNQAFIEDNPPMDRVLAAGAEAQGQQYLADIMYKRTAVRPIPTFGIPASLTHF